jgi:hypothetical protein
MDQVRGWAETPAVYKKSYRDCIPNALELSAVDISIVYQTRSEMSTAVLYRGPNPTDPVRSCSSTSRSSSSSGSRGRTARPTTIRRCGRRATKCCRGCRRRPSPSNIMRSNVTSAASRTRCAGIHSVFLEKHRVETHRYLEKPCVCRRPTSCCPGAAGRRWRLRRARGPGEVAAGAGPHPGRAREGPQGKPNPASGRRAAPLGREWRCIAADCLVADCPPAAGGSEAGVPAHRRRGRRPGLETARC